MSSNQPPPQPNPVLSAYESFVETTPLVTRYVLSTLSLSWIFSWIIDFSFAFANIPLFSIMHLELYRIVLSPLICTSLLTLVFTFMSFVENGKRLEYSMGSTAFLMFLMTIGTLTNLIFLAVCFLFYFLTNNMAWLVTPSVGIWIVVLGMIAVECANAPRDSKRRLFVFTVPTLYYPLAVLALFALFAGFSLAYFISVGVGYAFAFGYFDRIKISTSTFQRWEDGCLRNFTQRKGWVVGNEATGDSVWTSSESSAGTSSWSPSTFFRGQPQQQGTVASPPAGGWSNPANIIPATVLPSRGGHTLGGTSSTNYRDPKAARLAALERRVSSKSADPEAQNDTQNQSS